VKRFSRAELAVLVGGLLVEAGCLWIWTESPRLTAIYNADFTREFFQHAPWLQGLADQAPPPAAPRDLAVRLIAGLLAMSFGYVLAISAASDAATWWVVAFAGVFRLTLASLPGLFSTDVFSYVMYGRIAGVDGGNPYADPPAAFPMDPFLGWVFPFWRDQPSVYGPLWTDLSALASRVSADWGPFEQVLLYRASLLALEAVSLAALWWILGKLQRHDRKRAWLVYAWSPLVLFDLVGASHNDAGMLALMLLGIGVVATVPASAREPATWRWLLGLLLLAFAALVKYAAAVVVLAAATTWGALAQTRRVQVYRLVVGLGVPLLLAAVLWWPWLGASGALTPLGDAAGGKLVLNSAPDLAALGVADEVLVPRGVPTDAAHALARLWMRWATRLIFVAYASWELGRLWASVRSGAAFDDAFRAAMGVSARLLLVLPLLVLTWVWSWYLSWSLAIAVVTGSRTVLTRVVVAYTLVALPIVYAHQYLNEEFSGIWILVMALAPLGALVPIRGPTWTRKFVDKEGWTQ
jgi:hypothetical protein